MHGLKPWDWDSWKLNGDILAQAENMRLRFMKVKLWHSCTGWKPGAWVSWKWNSEVLAQDENQGPEFHENEIVKFLHRMKAWSLSFMSATLGYQTFRKGFHWSQFVPHTPFLLKDFSPNWGLKPGCLSRMLQQRVFRCLFGWFNLAMDHEI